MQKPLPRVRGRFAVWFDQKLRNSSISPTEIAARAGVSSALVSMLRHGRRRPSYEVVLALARAIDAEAELDEALAAADFPIPVASAPTSAGQVSVRNIPPERCLAIVEALAAETRNPDWRARMQAGLELAKYLPVGRVAHDALERAATRPGERPLVRDALVQALAYYEPGGASASLQEAVGQTRTLARPKRRRRT